MMGEGTGTGGNYVESHDVEVAAILCCILFYLGLAIGTSEYHLAKNRDYVQNISVLRDSANARINQLEQTIKTTKSAEQKKLLEGQKTPLRNQLSNYESAIKEANDEKKKAEIYFKSLIPIGGFFI